MRFSLILEAQTADPTRAGDHRVFAETLELALLAEECGFDVVWAVEHTALTMYAHMSAPETFLAYVAGATERIGVGHGVICLPPMMNHPVKVAERCATLDILSGGRLHVGFGKGGTEQEAGTFGYRKADLAPMVEEAMRLVPRYWTEDVVEHRGRFVDVPPREIHPKPLQVPHPPLYQACTRTETLVDAGRRGIGALVLGFGGPDQVAHKNQVYRRAFAARDPAEQVGSRPTEHLAALCPAVVLDNGTEARRLGIRGQRFFVESIGHWGSNGVTPLPDPSTWTAAGDTVTDGSAVVEASIGSETVRIDLSAEAAALHNLIAHHHDTGPVIDLSAEAAALRNPNHGYGTAEDCIGYVERLAAAGADEIMFLCQMGTIPQAAQIETVRNIGDRVIPRLRGDAGRDLTEPAAAETAS